MVTLRARGIFRRQKITPMIGDSVLFSPPQGDDEGWIDEILPRQNLLVRPPVANVSRLIVVVAPVPKPDLLLTDLLLADARRQGIAPVLVIHKCDLDPVFCRHIQEEYALTGDAILITSVKTGDGLTELASLMQTGISCFAGQSGTGKSSLVNAIAGIKLVTGEISQKIGRGKHTTRHAELIIHNGYQVLDTAGFSLLVHPEAEDPVFLKETYPEFLLYEPHCRYQPCYHRSEPGCAVLKAASDGKISAGRIERYHILLEKAKEAWKDRYE
jgi:ribosome biogenesis GTPase